MKEEVNESEDIGNNAFKSSKSHVPSTKDEQKASQSESFLNKTISGGGDTQLPSWSNHSLNLQRNAPIPATSAAQSRPTKGDPSNIAHTSSEAIIRVHEITKNPFSLLWFISTDSNILKGFNTSTPKPASNQILNDAIVDFRTLAYS